MRQREFYTPVGLNMTGFRKIKPGYFLRASPSGATYLVVDAKKSLKIRGKVNLKCLRWPPDAVDVDAVVLTFTWNKRESKKALKSRKPKLRSSGSNSPLA